MSYVIDIHHSPFARLLPVPLAAVTLTDAFWQPRLQLNRQSVLPGQYQLMESTGRLDNFRRAAGRADLPFQGRFYNDSDVYKWLEAACWSLATTPDPTLARNVETLIGLIEAAQQPDGYLNTYFMFEREAERWTNLRDWHELYCAGHLIQAAIAHYRVTGSERLLAVVRRLADHIGVVFGPQGRPGTSGHPEIELALVELARTTGESVYLKQAQSFLDQRGHGLIGGREYHLDHQPFRQMERLTGHAVRALYLAAGATDLYAETGEPALRDTVERLWQRMVTRQMYVNGALGARHEGEAFGQDYELPQARAYAETCAAIASMMWQWRLLCLEGAARYADLMEWTLYNAVLPGLSLDGQSYFYVNPLANDGSHRRQPYFDCACCPPNIARLLASLPGYVYSLSADETDMGLWVHLYAAGSARLTLPDGRVVGLIQETRYPWDGEIKLTIEGEGDFSVRLRVPGWCDSGASLEINNQPFSGERAASTYVHLRRVWQPGDMIKLHLPMPVRRLESHPYVLENRGRVALSRGPLLYCVEQADHPGVELRDLTLPGGASGLTPIFQPELLGGVIALHGQAEVIPLESVWAEQLYRPVPSQSESLGRGQPIELTAIPYFAWANRAAGPMQVWLAEKPD